MKQDFAQNLAERITAATSRETGIFKALRGDDGWMVNVFALRDDDLDPDVAIKGYLGPLGYAVWDYRHDLMPDYFEDSFESLIVHLKNRTN
jgi:hypothetical protein